MLWKKIVRDYFYFTRKERLGVMVLAGIITGVFLLPKFFEKRTASVLVPAELIPLLDSVEEPGKNPRYPVNENNSRRQNQFRETAQGELFYFDPNTVSVAEWQKLGLSEKTARTIQKYRSRGGRFRQPGDLQKIWGLPPGFYERVKGHIVIADDENRAFSKRKPETIRSPQEVLVNSADSSAFESLPGIGPKLAARIVQFREKLGGFYSVDQVAETYGLPDSTFQRIRERLKLDRNVVQIALNSATKEDLKSHPYIRWKLANAIVEYRNQHGVFRELEDIRKIALVDPETFEKIKPYLKL